jgi:uncharacterized membrane protein
MSHILRFVRVFALGTWLGAIIFFSFAVAPGVFALLKSRDEAGAMVGFALARLHLIGVIAAVVCLLAALILGRSFKALVKPAALAVTAMLFLTLASARIVIPRMDALRTQMGSIEATPANDSRRVEFDKLHGISVKLEGSVLLLGLLAMFLTVREMCARSE